MKWVKLGQYRQLFVGSNCVGTYDTEERRVLGDRVFYWSYDPKGALGGSGWARSAEQAKRLVEMMHQDFGCLGALSEARGGEVSVA